MSQTILVVDDDDHIRDVVCFALEQAGYTVIEAENGVKALAQYKEQIPSLIVLDIMMPEMDGLEVCRELRKFSTTPIIFLTAKDDEIDSIVGLELGGDDYLSKPFSPRNLVARVKAVLRRTSPSDTYEASTKAGQDTQVGQLTLNRETFKAFWNQQELTLTLTEFNLLQSLSLHPSKVFSRDELMHKAYDNIIVSDRTIDSHIRRVRAKIVNAGGNAIETVHGVGYKLGACL